MVDKRRTLGNMFPSRFNMHVLAYAAYKEPEGVDVGTKASEFFDKLVSSGFTFCMVERKQFCCGSVGTLSVECVTDEIDSLVNCISQWMPRYSMDGIVVHGLKGNHVHWPIYNDLSLSQRMFCLGGKEYQRAVDGKFTVEELKEMKERYSEIMSSFVEQRAEDDIREVEAQFVRNV